MNLTWLSFLTLTSILLRWPFCNYTFGRTSKTENDIKLCIKYGVVVGSLLAGVYSDMWTTLQFGSIWPTHWYQKYFCSNSSLMNMLKCYFSCTTCLWKSAARYLLSIKVLGANMASIWIYIMKCDKLLSKKYFIQSNRNIKMLFQLRKLPLKKHSEVLGLNI